jgi:twinkle protein
MPRYIEQLYTNRTDVLNYLTQERGLTEDTLKRYRVGAFMLRVKDAAAPEGHVEHPCVAFGWYERNKDNPSGDLIVTRIKTRSLKSKSLQRLDPVGGKWGMFGWHLVEEEIRLQGSQRSSVRSMVAWRKFSSCP